MLRLKQALLDCGIQQKTLAEASGFGKTQISLTLNSGKLPADADKFRDGVSKLVDEHQSLIEWLAHNHLVESSLCESIIGSVDEPIPYKLCVPSPDLERVLCEIAGRAVLAAEGCNNLVLCLARATAYLHRSLSDLVGEDAPYLATKEYEVFAILKGIRP